MKQTTFFLTKSESFLTKLNSIKLINNDYTKVTNDIYQEPTNDNNSAFRKQKEKLNEIQFQINLMLTEFDNGELFIEKLKDYNPIQRYFNNDNQLNQLLTVIKSFIKYLKEYRI